MLFAAALCAGCSFSSGREAVKERFKDDGRSLLDIPYAVPEGAAALSLRFGPETLAKHELYLEEPGGKSYVYIDSQGIVRRDGAEWGRLHEAGEILISQGGRTLFVDGRPLPIPADRFKLFWAARERRPPALEVHIHPAILAADSFMRENLAEGGWNAIGPCRINRHGGGAAVTIQQQEDDHFARAVNPFTVIVGDGADLSYGQGDWLHYHGEASFYFGRKKEGPITDLQSLPTADMLVAQGSLAGEMIAFGWRHDERAFCLLMREPGGFRVLARYHGPRPAISTWIRLGLRVLESYRVEGWLDGVPVISADLEHKVMGPFHILAAQGDVEFDDVRIFSLPESERAGAPLYVKSREFAHKKETARSDPAEFAMWAKGSATFAQRTRMENGENYGELVSRWPIMGGFRWEALPHHAEAGKLTDGRYVYTLWSGNTTTPSDLEQLQPVLRIAADLSAAGWRIADAPAGVPPLIARLKFELRPGSGVFLMTEGDAVSLGSAPSSSTLHFGVALRYNGNTPFYPRPEHHPVICRNLVHELFEEAPTEWSWVEGSFRMDTRWACSDMWNLMSCGATGVPLLVSKRTFAGAQEHECFMSLRPVTPYDGGETDFYHDVVQERVRQWRFFVRHNGWYNRHDLNFSFCMNGRDPLSGYAVLYGANDNSEMLLMKKGKVLARNSKEHFPVGGDHTPLHWKWWHFAAHLLRDRVQVDLNGERIFDVAEPEPLPGGHTAFWTVRNGFTLAKVTSMAESLGRRPAVLYVEDGTDSGTWRPLLQDAILVRPGSRAELTRFTANIGAGPFAVRWTPLQPVDLARTPILELPLEIGPETRVQLHVFAAERSFLIPIYKGGVKGMKVLLTPEYERGEMFQLKTLDPAIVIREKELFGDYDGQRLRIDLLKELHRRGVESPCLQSLTLGNSSNENYLLAGNEANKAGAWYEAGEPVFKSP